MTGLSVKRVVVGAIGAIGGYLFLVRLGGLAKFEPDWLPYVAELLGALIVGGALARVGTRHRFEALAAGVLSVVIVGTVAFASPTTYGWVAARAAHPWPTAVALAIGCGAAAQLGAWFAYGRGGLLSIVVLSTGVSFAVVLFGGRIVAAFGAGIVTVDESVAIVLVLVLALLAGFTVQSVVPLANAGVCASGTAIFVAVSVIETEVHGQDNSGLLWMVLTVAAAFGGALVAQALRPKSRELETSAFD
jgi:hypothetical protein